VVKLNRMSEPHAVTVALGWDGATLGAVGLEMSFCKAGRRESCHPEGLVEMCVSLPGHQFSALCFGYDISRFCDDLEQCWKTLKGRSEFMNQEGTVRVIISAADPGRGQLAVAGQVELLGGGIEAPTVGILPFPGVRFTFDGLVLEQSYVPTIIRELRSFLSSEGISTLHPMTSGK
jgi:hypothetical protein